MPLLEKRRTEKSDDNEGITQVVRIKKYGK
jgi:hypothetical protein